MVALIQILKWSTKIASIAILALVFFIVGAHLVEGFGDFPAKLSNEEIIASFYLGALILGTLLGLKWKLIGGVLAVLGYIGFIIGKGGAVSGMVFIVFFIVGVSNITLYFLSKKNK